MFGGQQQHVGRGRGRRDRRRSAGWRRRRPGRRSATARPRRRELPSRRRARADVRLRAHAPRTATTRSSCRRRSPSCRRGPGLRFEQDPELQQSLLWGQGEMHLRVALDRLTLQVPHRGRGPGRRTRPTARPSARAPRPRPPQEAERRPRPVRRRQDRDPAAPARRGLRVRRQDRRRRGAAPVHPGGRGRAPGTACSSGPLGFPVVDVSVTLFDGQFHSVDSSRDRVQDGDRAGAEGGPAAVRAGAARADPGGRHLGAVRLHLEGAPAGHPEARPDPGLRRQGRLDAAGTEIRPTSRRPRCTT